MPAALRQVVIDWNKRGGGVCFPAYLSVKRSRVWYDEAEAINSSGQSGCLRPLAQSNDPLHSRRCWYLNNHIGQFAEPSMHPYTRLAGESTWNNHRPKSMF